MLEGPHGQVNKKKRIYTLSPKKQDNISTYTLLCVINCQKGAVICFFYFVYINNRYALELKKLFKC